MRRCHTRLFLSHSTLTLSSWSILIGRCTSRWSHHGNGSRRRLDSANLWCCHDNGSLHQCRVWSLLLPSLSDLCTLRWCLIGCSCLALWPCGCGLQLGVVGVKALQQFPSNTIRLILHDLINLCGRRAGKNIMPGFKIITCTD